jgi:threonine dehydrogenase-like Zn-dependent dehydrogenase
MPEIMKLTGGKGVDLVFDTTYSEASFIDTAKAVREGGTWVVLGVGPLQDNAYSGDQECC